MTRPFNKDRLAVRSFDPGSTWFNAVDAVQLGCDPREVAEALLELLSDDERFELRDHAPIGAQSEAVVFNSPTARLCWAIGEAFGEAPTWAPKIARPPETG